MFRPKKKTEDLLLSITKNCELPIKQTHRKQQKTLEFEIIKSKEIMAFEPSVHLGFDSEWKIGLACLKAHNSVFNIKKIN